MPDSPAVKVKTAVLLSGGVDSLVAAHILKQDGQDLIGIHFVTGYEKPGKEGVSTGDAVARRTAAALAAQLKIPVEIMDCRRAFKSKVVDYFTRTYAAGQTPNPCLVCNPGIKFGTVFAFAESLGAKKLATGHYARTYVDRHGSARLLRGKDRAKDQSYFLARLARSKLSRAVFPLGEMTKRATVDLARKAGLVPVTPRESQDVCFIQGNRYSDFLAYQPGFTATPGPIKDTSGAVIGQHSGLHLFTIGQRRGINCPAGEAYYVVAIDAQNNSLTVGFKQDTLSDSCTVEDINWIVPEPDAALHADTQVRYRHEAAPSRLVPLDGARADVFFDLPQSAIAPGQGAVFYKGEEVLGGGFIRKTEIK